MEGTWSEGFAALELGYEHIQENIGNSYSSRTKQHVGVGGLYGDWNGA